MFPEVIVNPIVKVVTLVTAFQKVLPKNLFFGGEIHDFWEFIYVIDGTIGCSADNKVYELSKGEMVIHAPKEFHKIWSAGNSQVHLFIFSFSCTNGTNELMNLHARNPIIKIDSSLQHFLKNIIEHFYPIQQKYEGKDFLKSWDLSPKLIQLGANHIENFLLSLIETSSPHAFSQAQDNIGIYNKAISIMTNNLEKNLTTSEIACLCGTSVSNLKRVFSHHSAYGIHKCFTNLKILKAIDLLAENISIKDISDKLCFKNPNYFGIVFKRETGYSPRTYYKNIIMKKNKLNITPKIH